MAICMLQGGMKAVVWTDAFQGVIYLIGVLIVLIEVTYVNPLRLAQLVCVPLYVVLSAGYKSSWWNHRGMGYSRTRWQIRHLEVHIICNTVY